MLCLRLFSAPLFTEWQHAKKGLGVGGEGYCGRYQYSKRTLSETTISPMGPSARQSLFMDAEHASRHLVSSTSPSSLPLPDSLPP